MIERPVLDKHKRMVKDAVHERSTSKNFTFPLVLVGKYCKAKSIRRMDYEECLNTINLMKLTPYETHQPTSFFNLLEVITFTHCMHAY